METLGLVIVTQYRTEYIPESFPHHQSHLTQMFLNGRERRESDRGGMVVVVQPDRRRKLWLDPQTQTFTVRPVFELATEAEKKAWQTQGERYTRRHALLGQKRVSYDIFLHADRTDDVGEVFGLPTRRYLTRRKDVYPDGVGKAQESVTDGWYLDFAHPAISESSRVQKIGLVHMGDEQPVIHRSGVSHYSGIPAKVVTTTRQSYPAPAGASREHISKQTIEIISIKECHLESALFEEPKSFRERPAFTNRRSEWRKQIFKVLLRRTV